ncbi:hypothetical protein Hte_002291 [Hypoxylon texense]
MDVGSTGYGNTLFHSFGLMSNDYNGTILNGVRDYTQLLFFSIELNWCLRTYDKVIASPAGIKDAPYTSEPLYRHLPVNSDLFGYWSYQADSTQSLFNISMSLRDGLWEFVNELFSRELHTPLTLDEEYESDTKFGEFLYGADLANFTRNLEETLTNQIRSSSPGDNEQALMLPGQAFYQETYWHVEWPWITVPIAEAFLTLLLLVISIIATWDQPLLRSSALALLFHGLQENDLDMQLPYTRADPDGLERLAKGVYVEFRENKQGVLKFVRADKNDGV